MQRLNGFQNEAFSDGFSACNSESIIHDESIDLLCIIDWKRRNQLDSSVFTFLSHMPAGRTTNGVSLVSYTNEVCIQKNVFFFLHSSIPIAALEINLKEQEAICTAL